MRRLVAVLSVSLFTLTACGAKPEAGNAPAADTPPAPVAAVGAPEGATFAPALGVDLAAMTKLPSGVYIQDLTVGTGARADSGKTLAMHYTGWLPDGTEFDSSRDRGPYEFQLGPGAVINGWHLGSAGMHVGGKRLLVLPSDQGYGPGGSGRIPANAVLVFQVELVEVK